MKKCKTCKFWIKNYYEPGFMTCDSAKIKTGYGFELSELQPDEILIEDDEGWGWIVGPEFGCVHHEKR